MSLRVLIVEDEPLIVIDLTDILERAGHRIVGTAPDMATALDLAAANPHLDLAVVDIVLANAPNGIVAARRLREDHDVGSLFVSANITERAVAMASEWAPVGFVGKPFREREILDAIAHLPEMPTFA